MRCSIPHRSVAAPPSGRYNGSARGLYPGLWNRGVAFTTHGDPEPLRFLREQLRVAR